MTPERAGRFARLVAWGRELLWGEAARRGPAEAVRVLAVSAWKFREDRGFLRASALTYITLLSLVPVLALMFAVLKGLGVQQRLEPVLLEHLAVGNPEVIAQILDYVDRTKVGALGAVGLVTLVLTAVSVLGNVELSFNDIWQVRRGRNLIRKIADYTAILVVGPVLLLASLSINATLQSPAVLARLSVVGEALPALLSVAPYGVVWLLFTALYLVLPNCRVPVGAALLAGVLAGSAWQVAELLYLRFQFGMGRYNAIYGAMAQLPLLLAWVYLSWCIVLLGAELAFVFQLPGRGRYLGRRFFDLWVPRAAGALPLLLAVARRFEQGLPAASEPALTDELGLHPGEAVRLISRLVEQGLLTLTHDDPPLLVPARSPDRTTAAELLATLARLEGEGAGLDGRLRQALDREFGAETWAELALRGGP